MTPRRSRLALLALPVVGVFALAGCSGSAAPDTSDASDGSDALVQIVASTNVYGQIAQQIGGEFVEVTSIVTSGAQDPHSYEASAQDQLHVKRADLIIENGGGYDAFLDGLIESSGSTAPVITAVEFSHSWPENAGHDEEAHDEEDHAAHEEDDHDEHGHDHIEGFNEHVWYDPHTMAHLAEDIAHELGELRPEHAAAFEANAEDFHTDIETLETALADIETAHAGEAVFVTEPVPVYLVTAAGLVDVTPPAFSEAVEEGQDVPPATLLEAQRIIRDGTDDGPVRVVIANAQTGGAETTAIIADAESAEIPVLEFTETLPEGETYISWMQDNIDRLADALNS